MLENFTGSINVDELKKTIDENKAKAEKFKKAKNFWKPTLPETVIRIIPYRHGKNPFNELHFHYDVNGDNILCPKHTHGKADCIICDYVKELYASKNPDDLKIAKDIRAKNRYYIPMIDKTEISTGKEPRPYFWGVAPKYYNMILDYVLMEEDYGDIAHPEKGHDIIVKWEEKSKEKPFGEVSIVVRAKETPMLPDAEISRKIYNDVPNVFELFKEWTNEELLNKLDAFRNSRLSTDHSGNYATDSAVEHEVGSENQSLKDKLAAITAEE